MTELLNVRPDFLIIGAAKSATSWLAATLRQDARCFVPAPEIHYFSRHFDRPWSWYAGQFDGAAPGQLLGEKSNSYLSDLNAAARIKATLPDAKLLVVLRNPLDRAYSAFCMQYDRGKIGDDIDRALDPARSHVPHTLTDGLYATCLEPYFETFRPDQLLILTFERQFAGAESAARIGAFLDLGTPPLQPLAERVNAKKNEANAPMWAKRLLWPLLRSEEMRVRLTNIAKQTGLFDVAARIAGRKARTYPAFTPVLRDRLRDYYRSDIMLLSERLGHDFTPWLSDKQVSVMI